MALEGAALVGTLALGSITLLSVLRARTSPRPTNLHSEVTELPPACEASLRSTLASLRFEECRTGTMLTGKTREVEIAFFLTYTVPRSIMLRNWTWTTHWAMVVDWEFYELVRDYSDPAVKDRFVFEHLSHEQRLQKPGRKERLEIQYTWSMGVTHLTDEQLISMGNSHANGFQWDPVARNCQTFLHDAYFGKPLISPFRKINEIRCSACCPKRDMPPFTVLVVSTTMASMYIVEQAVEWTLHLAISPWTLALRALPVVFGITAMLPAARVAFMSLFNGTFRHSTLADSEALRTVLLQIPETADSMRQLPRKDTDGLSSHAVHGG